MAFPIFPFVPQDISAVPVEVHPLDPADYARRLPPHGHMFFELLVIRDGAGLIMLDGKQYPALPGHAFVIPPGLPHDVRALGTATGWAMLFLPDGPTAPAGKSPGLSLQEDIPAGLAFDLFRSLRMRGPIILDEPALTMVDLLFRKIDTELRGRATGYDFAVRAAAQLILVEIGRGVVAASREPESRDDLRERLLVTRAFADIDANYNTASGLDAAANRLGISAAHLTTRLRRLTGRTYGEWVIERRMIEARHRLVCSNDSLSKIAEDLGYQNPESFIRRFRAHHAATPARWRNEARQQTVLQEAA
ncbi:MAG: AraC family transcriptional regulator [Proteobacteria bacterium]|nr:AraC family transcriptional regulator [Pseudomonadota bacterium]